MKKGLIIATILISLFLGACSHMSDDYVGPNDGLPTLPQ